MNSAPLVSVLMGVRNGGDLLREAIDSIFGQTLTDLELIVVEDGSDDGTPDLLASYDDPRLVVLRNPANIGLTRSLNRALERAGGRFVARQDADDRSAATRLERQLEFLEKSPEVDLCGTWVRFIDSRGRALGRGHPAIDPDEVARLLPRGSGQPYHGSILARREMLVALGGYREAFRYAQDYDLYLRAIGRHRIANVPDELYEFRFHGGTVSVRNQELQERFATLARDLWKQRREHGRDELEAGVAVQTLLERVEVPARSPETWSDRAVHRGLIGDLAGYRSALRELIRVSPADPRPYLRLALSLAGRRTVQKIEYAWRRKKFLATSAGRDRR